MFSHSTTIIYSAEIKFVFHCFSGTENERLKKIMAICNILQINQLGYNKYYSEIKIMLHMLHPETKFMLHMLHPETKIMVHMLHPETKIMLPMLHPGTKIMVHMLHPETKIMVHMLHPGHKIKVLSESWPFSLRYQLKQ